MQAFDAWTVWVPAEIFLCACNNFCNQNNASLYRWQKKSGFAGFLDLENAFDTINHSILLTKLDLYRLRGITNTSLQSYLTNLKQYVSFCEKTLN